MSMNGKRIERGKGDGNGQGDTFCRTVIAALAAMLALKLCEYIRKWIQG
jgi:hypothetical protein